jgi:hypothetical protein
VLDPDLDEDSIGVIKMFSPITLLALAARTASDVGLSFPLPRGLKALIFLFDVTNADKDANDTLNVYIQESPDGGTSWNDIVSFAQVIGTDNPSKKLAKINCEISPETELGALADASLAAGSVLQGPVCPLIRPKWVIVDGGGDADQTFTFGLTMLAIR